MSESPDSQKPVVFISYSHKDERWKDLLLPQLKQFELLDPDLLTIWNDRDIGHGANWYADIRDRLAHTKFAICLISANFLASRFCMEEEIPYLLQQRAERGVEILPILVERCVWKAHPWLKQLQMLPRDGKNLTTDFKDDPAQVFAEVAEYVYDGLQPDYVAPAPIPPTGEPPEKVDITRLPETGDLLFGRRDELRLLDNAWESDATNVVVLKAAGGVGKSTLMRVWTKSLEQDNYRGAQRVFAWSFYSQGTNERVTSADAFIAEALTWFGDPDPTAGSPWDKGERLARLVAEQPTLLLLDGMEPLQSHVKEEKGALKDPGLQMLVRDLARENPGLCVISTRETVGDLADSRFAASVIHEDLEHVSLTAGRALMRVRGVTGDDDALESAVNQFDRHALAINLLASYLMEFENGDIDRVADIKSRPPRGGEDARRAGEAADQSAADAPIPPAWHVIAAFERRLQDTPGLDLLRLLGLFDRPITDGEFQALTEDPPIPGLTDKLFAGTGSGTGLIFPAGSSQMARRFLDRLRKLGLIAAKSHHEPNEIDAHPLIREYFEGRLKGEERSVNAGEVLPFTLPTSSFREAHRRLYEHLKQSAPKLPDNLNDMMPLYHAVAHGCKAGLGAEVIRETYFPRILQIDVQSNGDGKYMSWALGAFGSTISTLAPLFGPQWGLQLCDCDDEYRDELCNDLGVALTAVGRFYEAQNVLGESLRGQVANLVTAAVRATNLGDVYLASGDVATLIATAERGIAFADQYLAATGKPPVRSKTHIGITLRADLANALMLAGRKEAARGFEDAEKLHRADTRHGRDILDSFWGPKYCELLIGPWESTANATAYSGATTDPSSETHTSPWQVVKDTIEHRCRRCIEWAKAGETETATLHRTIGMNYLILARVGAVNCVANGVIVDGSKTESIDEEFDRAVTILRESGQRWVLPAAYIARAILSRMRLVAKWRQLSTTGNVKEPSSTRSEPQIHQQCVPIVLGEAAIPDDLQSLAERDLSEAETIAERGSMLIWQIEAALERTRLFLTLAQIEEGSRGFTQMDADDSEPDPRLSASISGSSSAETGKNHREQAQQKLDEAKELIRQTEKPYEPHVPNWDDWEPPDYVGVFKEGDIVGYHCRNDEIDRLQTEIDALTADS